MLADAVAKPFERKEFAYEYARRLQANGKFEDAIAMFRQVPTDDRNYAESQYYLMVAVRQQLDHVKETDPAHATLLTELNGLIDEVNKAMGTKLAAETNPQRKRRSSRCAWRKPNCSAAMLRCTIRKMRRGPCSCYQLLKTPPKGCPTKMNCSAKCC